jgi:hypothetical protein
MTKHNVTGGNRCDLTKYRITLAIALSGLILSGWMFQTAYDQHMLVLRAGDEAGELLQMRGLV